MDNVIVYILAWTGLMVWLCVIFVFSFMLIKENLFKDKDVFIVTDEEETSDENAK